MGLIVGGSDFKVNKKGGKLYVVQIVDRKFLKTNPKQILSKFVMQ